MRVCLHACVLGQSFYESLYKLYLYVGNYMAITAQTDHGRATQMNTSLANFMVNLFSLADRGMCFKLVDAFLQHLEDVPDPSGYLVRLKLLVRWNIPPQAASVPG